MKHIKLYESFLDPGADEKKEISAITQKIEQSQLGDAEMEEAIGEIFGDMPEEELDAYLEELAKSKPKWLQKVIQWFQGNRKNMTGKQKVRKKSRMNKNTEIALETAASLTFGALWYKLAKKAGLPVPNLY